ncbi:MAG: amidase [Myxococcota bacterium]
MKRVLTVVAPVVALAAIALGMYVMLHWEALSTFPGMPSSYEAKEYCSCRWVSERDDAFCAAYVAQSTVPMQGREVDEQAHTVTSRALWVSNTARYVDRRHGCVLDR